MSTNFDFAKKFAPDVADRLNKADDYLYIHKDPVAAVESSGTALEQLIIHIATKEGLAETSFYSLKDGIEHIGRKCGCTRKVIQWMNTIRKKRNDASHENKATEYDAEIVVKNAHRILQWCVENYRTGKASEYVIPASQTPMVCIEGVFKPLDHGLLQRLYSMIL